MKHDTKKVIPIFVAVVTLLAIGAVGEMIVSLFQRSKEFFSSNESCNEHTFEVAPSYQ